MSVHLNARLAAWALALATALSAPVALAGTLSIDRWTVDGGGAGFADVGQIVLSGTCGQPDAGRLVGSPYAVTGGFWMPGGSVPLGVGDGVDPSADPRITEARVLGARPNPLYRGTRIAFDLPESRDVDVRVFDVTGALVRTLEDGRMEAGHQALDWDVRDSNGRLVRPGMYLVRIRLGSLERSLKLTVMH